MPQKVVKKSLKFLENYCFYSFTHKTVLGWDKIPHLYVINFLENQPQNYEKGGRSKDEWN